jgi:anti-anti-sigma factor
MSRPFLTFTEEALENVTVFHLEGKIIGDENSRNVCSRISELFEENIKYFVLNFRHVKWINSLGLGAIMGCLVSLRNKGGDIFLTNVHDAPMKYFRITQLDNVIEIYSTVDEAVLGCKNKQ